MKTDKFSTLINEVISNSTSKTFDEARTEWKMTAYHTATASENISCICGHPHLVNLYEITNVKNQNILYPIGSECITKFNFDYLDYQLKMAQYGKKIFKNKGKRYDGLTYDEICERHPDYVEFLKKNGLKTKYIKLVEYYDFKNSLNK